MRLTKDEVIAFFLTITVFGGLFLFLLPYLQVSFNNGRGAATTTTVTNSKYSYAEPIDKFNDVIVYYNDKVSTVSGRNIAPDGYNLGLKYQCVEFVKRYYYEFYNHKMPNSYGHAKDFFDENISDGLMNRDRNLRQFTNGSISRPRVGDILVFGPTPTNKYGHIGIVSKANRRAVEMVHQNPGIGNNTRTRYTLTKSADRWYIHNEYLLGWLRRS